MIMWLTWAGHLTSAGVGDLYTDPQMHTLDQRDYGDANLGTKGMALFFSSHVCNPICIAMGETEAYVWYCINWLFMRAWYLCDYASKTEIAQI